jgi:hypothetical protein
LTRQKGTLKEFPSKGKINVGTALVAVRYSGGDNPRPYIKPNEVLKIFEEIGMPEKIGIVKGNIERIKQMINDG